MNKSFADLSYRPEWEHYHFDKEGYKKLFEEIALKDEGASLIRYDHTLKVANIIVKLWNQLLGLLGFENRTDVIKVNYELLKILRYGENHHFFDDSEIHKILVVTQKKLSKDHQYRPVGQVLGHLLDGTTTQDSTAENPSILINHRIELYYREHRTELKEAFWPRLFHYYVSPLQRDAALVHYNMGRIHLGEKNYEKAILSFQNALEIDPDYPDCLFHLSKTLFAHGEHLHNQKNWLESLSLYERTLQLLQTVNIKKLTPSESNDINDLLVKTYLNKFSLEVRVGKVEEGIETLRSLAKATATSLEHYLKTYLYHISPGSPLFPTDLQQGKLLMRVVREFSDFKTRFPYLMKAIGLFEKLIKDSSSQEARKQLISAFLVVAKEFLREGDCEKAEEFLNKGFAQFNNFKKTLSDKQQKDLYGDFFKNYQQLAATFQERKNTSAAVSVYQQIKVLFSGNQQFRGKCCYEVAKLLTETDLSQAWKEIEEAWTLDSQDEYIQQQKVIAIKIAEKASSEFQYKKSKAFWKKVLAMDPENFEANRGIAFVYIELHKDDRAEFHLKKALAQKTNDAELVYLKGLLNEIKDDPQGALECYLEAFKLDKLNPTYKKTLLAASIKHGDKIYARGSCRSENIQQELLDFVEFVLASPESKKIEAALGAWKGTASQENKEFKSLGQDIETVDDLEAQAKRAIALIEKAYDGESHHLSPSELPEAIYERMQILNQQISQMVAYYASLKEATEKFVTYVCRSDFYPEIERALGAWMGSLSSSNKEFRSLGKDAEELVEIEREFKRALEIIETAYDGVNPHLSPHQMPQALREKMEAMRLYLAPTTLASEAIPHYLRAFELSPNEYHDYLNRLIDSYFRIHDYKQAIEWYEKLSQAFPHSSVRINPEAYLRVAQTLLNANKFADSLRLISKAIELAPDRPLFRKALSHAYYLIGEGFLKKQNNSTKALEYYQKALTCGVEAEGACYASLADYYEKQVPFAASTAIRGSLMEQIIEYRRKAAELEPNNAEIQFQYARVLYHEDILNRANPIPYLEKAVVLDPNNVTYLYGLIMAKKRRGDNDDDLELAMSRFKSLGGNFATDYWEPISFY